MTPEIQFIEVVTLISKSRARAFSAVNKELIDLYWNIGAYISQRIASESWGKGTVLQLAAYIQKHEPGTSGFSDKNLWRMKQFYETYQDAPKLSPLVRVLNWTINITILSRCKNTPTVMLEYAMSRYMSPTLVSEYTTALPDKKLLQAKLHELYELYESQELRKGKKNPVGI